MASLAAPDDLSGEYQVYRDASAAGAAVEDFERRMQSKEKPGKSAPAMPAEQPEGWRVEEIPDRQGNVQRVAFSADGTQSRLLETVGAVAKDVGLGLIETPRQMMGGARDALQESMEFVESMATALDGKFIDLSIPDSKIVLPEVDPARTITGGAVRTMSQFLPGFVLARRS